MITGITLENFKAFKSRQVVPIRPITLIFGPNSSGKSCIFRALATLKHVSETQGDAEPDLVTAQWSTMRLGGWQNLVHNHDGASEIKLGVVNPIFTRTAIGQNLLDRPETQDIEFEDRLVLLAAHSRKEIEERRWVLGRLGPSDPAKIASFELEHQGLRPLKMRQDQGEWNVCEEGEIIKDLKADFAWQMSLILIDQPSKEPGEEERASKMKKNQEKFLRLIDSYPTKIRPLFLDDHYHAPRKAWRNTLFELNSGLQGWWTPDLSVELEFDGWFDSKRHSFTELLEQAEDHPEFLKDLWRAWCHHMAHVNMNCAELSDWIHLDPVRQRPDYPLTFGAIPDSAEANPWRMILRDEMIRKHASTILEELTGGEYRIGIRHRSAGISKAGDPSITEFERVERELCFVDKSGNSHSPDDLGYGISTLLPMVAALASQTGKLISIEQPELHLHPAMQAELADRFIESAAGEFVDREEEQIPSNRFLVETHSEHLILRILRRIRETTRDDREDWPYDLKWACRKGIKPEDVAVLYVQPGEDGAEIIELPITPDGDFDRPWPSGFFTERSKELY